MFRLFIHLLLVKQLVLLKIRGQLVDLFAESDLLGVSLEHLGPLLIHKFVLELLLFDVLDFLVTSSDLLGTLLVVDALCFLLSHVLLVLL